MSFASGDDGSARCERRLQLPSWETMLWVSTLGQRSVSAVFNGNVE